MTRLDLYRELCGKLGKAKVWNMNVDEICEYIEHNYNVEKRLNE